MILRIAAEFIEAPLHDRVPLFCGRVSLQDMVVCLGSNRITVLWEHLFKQHDFVYVGAVFMALSNHNFLPGVRSVPAYLPSSNTETRKFCPSFSKGDRG